MNKLKWTLNIVSKTVSQDVMYIFVHVDTIYQKHNNKQTMHNSQMYCSSIFTLWVCDVDIDIRTFNQYSDHFCVAIVSCCMEWTVSCICCLVHIDFWVHLKKKESKDNNFYFMWELLALKMHSSIFLNIYHTCM